jgi:hypothetical protein
MGLLLQQPHMHGPGEPGSIVRAMGLKPLAYFGRDVHVYRVVSKRGVHHAAFKVGKVLEMHWHVKAPLGNLRPGQHECQPLLRRRQVLGVLPLVGFQPGYLVGWEALQKLPGQSGRATPQFDDLLIGQRHHVREYR